MLEQTTTDTHPGYGNVRLKLGDSIIKKWGIKPPHLLLIIMASLTTT